MLPVITGSIDWPLSVGVSVTSPLVIVTGQRVDGRRRVGRRPARIRGARRPPVSTAPAAPQASSARFWRTATGPHRPGSTPCPTRHRQGSGRCPWTRAGAAPSPRSGGGHCRRRRRGTVEDTTAAVVVVAVDATDGVGDAGGCTASAATRLASTLLVGPVPEAGTDAKPMRRCRSRMPCPTRPTTRGRAGER